MDNKLKKQIKNYVSSLIDNWANKSELLQYMEEYIHGFEDNKREIIQLKKELGDRDETISDILDHIDHLEEKIDKQENKG